MNTDCAANETCSPVTHECQPTCVTDNDCNQGNANICSMGTCVECITSNDCDGGAPICNTLTGTCVECLTNTDCMDPGNPICDPASGQCVECLFTSQCQNGDMCVDKECGG